MLAAELQYRLQKSMIGVCGMSEKVTVKQDVKFVKVKQEKAFLTPAWGCMKDDFSPVTKPKM